MTTSQRCCRGDAERVHLSDFKGKALIQDWIKKGRRADQGLKIRYSVALILELKFTWGLRDV